MAYKITDFDGGSLPVTTLNPYGAIDDDITVVNSKSNNDIQVTMQKIMARVSIAPNSLPDNSVNGFQLYNTIVCRFWFMVKYFNIRHQLECWSHTAESVYKSGGMGNMPRADTDNGNYRIREPDSYLTHRLLALTIIDICCGRI